MKRIALLAAALLAVLLVGGGIAAASVPAPDGTINGCRKNTDGSLRAIDSTASCPSGYTALNWPSRTGRVANADTADQLQQVVEVYSGALTLDSTTPNRDVFMLCPTGYKAVGGGIQDDQPFSGLPLVIWYSVPSVGEIGVGSQEAWRAGVSLPEGATEKHFTVRVRCVAAASQTVQRFANPGEAPVWP